jgi:hypothetical protein
MPAIRDDEFWRKRCNYKTFEECCEERWELLKQYAHRLMNAAAFFDLQWAKLRIDLPLNAPHSERAADHPAGEAKDNRHG